MPCVVLRLLLAKSLGIFPFSALIQSFVLSGGPICVGGRLLVFGEDPQRYFQVYDCATLDELFAGPNPHSTAYSHQDAIRLAKTFAIPVLAVAGGNDCKSELQLFTGCYHYARRWSLAEVLATPPRAPSLLNEYKGTGQGSTHDFQVVISQQSQNDVARPLFVSADEQSIRVYDLAKPRCIKKGLSGWVQQLLLATCSNTTSERHHLVSTGVECCGGDDSIWSVSPTAVEKVSMPKFPSKGLRLIQHTSMPGRYFGIGDSKLLELELDVPVRVEGEGDVGEGVDMASGALDWCSAKWNITRQLANIRGDGQPWLSAEGRLYSIGRDGMSEWAW